MELPSNDENQNGALYRFFRSDVEAMLREFPEGEPVELRKKHLINSLRTSDIYRSHPDQLNDILDRLATTEFQTTSVLGDTVTKEVVNFLQQKFSPEELETISRGYQSEFYGRKEINKLLTYDVKDNEVHIHVPLTLTESPSGLKKLFLEGLRKLCQELKENKELAQINSIKGESWIVFKHPKLLEAMGFTIVANNLDTEVGLAEISREELLTLYS